MNDKPITTLTTDSTVKAQRRLKWWELFDLLHEKFPRCFVKGREKNPLQIGISEVLKEALKNYLFTEGLLKAVLRFYTSKPSYLYAFKKDAMRVDLNGNLIEPVTDEQITNAQEKLRELADKSKAPHQKKQRKEQNEQPHKCTEMLKLQQEKITSLLNEANKGLTESDKKPTLSVKKKS